MDKAKCWKNAHEGSHEDEGIMLTRMTNVISQGVILSK